MRTARISDVGRGHPRAEFVPKLRVESFHRSDSEGCTIVIIERPSPDRFSTGPLYICALYAHAGWPPPESSCSIEPITACLLHQEPPRLGSRLEFWRTTPEADVGEQESLLAERHEPGNNLAETKVESA